MKKTFLGFLVLALSVSGAGAAPAKGTAPAVKSSLETRGLAFQRQGANVAFRAVEISGLVNLPAATLKNVLKGAASSGAQAVVTEAFTLTPGEQPALVETQGKLNASQMARLDDLVAAARAENLGLVFILSSGASPLGGQAQWAAWAGSNNPGVFFRDFQVKGWFQEAVKALLGRVNPKTKCPYGNDPTIWAWILSDSPLNAGGEASGFTQWVSDNAALVHSLAPGQRVALAFTTEEAPGISPEQASGAPGLDFLFLRLPKGSDGKAAASFASKTGRPVAAIYVSNPPNVLDPSVGGGVARLEGTLDDAKFLSLKQSLKAMGETAAASTGLFTRLEVLSGPVPELKDGASARVRVSVSSPAKLALRWGQEGFMDGRLEGPDAATHEFRLTGLTADRDLSIQVEAKKADGSLALSDRKSIRLPAVAPLTLNRPAESKRFITVKNGKFYDGDKPWRYVGTNIYYLHYAEPEATEYIFAHARSLGIKVVRLWAFGEAGSANPKDWKDWEVKRYFTLAPGKYYEPNLKNMDRIIASAGRHGIRLICGLSNNWTDFGGAPQWAAYFGSKDKNDFFDKPEVTKAWRDYVAMLMNRVNTVNGIAYKDDPTIFSWDLMNEPRYERDTSSKFLAKWIAENSAFVKRLGVKQLVSAGCEGLRASQGKHYSGADFIEIQQAPTIDFATYHIYPSSEYNRWNLETTVAIEKAYIQDAHAVLKKPIVMEEFGLPKSDPKYDKPLWIRAMLKAFYAAGGDGTNYWMIVEPTYRYGDGNEFDPTMTEIANAFSVTAREIEEAR
jgi:mannan endo-1,4-beta-mannosidase